MRSSSNLVIKFNRSPSGLSAISKPESADPSSEAKFGARSVGQSSVTNVGSPSLSQGRIIGESISRDD